MEQQDVNTVAPPRSGRAGLLALFWLGVTLVFVAVAGITHADAARLPGKVYFVQSKLPAKLSARKLVSFARKHRAKRLQETSHKKIEDREWRANLVLALKRPVGDFEYTLVFSKMQRGGPEYVKDMVIMVSNPKEKTFVQKIRLPREKFAANQRMHLAVTSRGRTLAETRFELVGQRIRRSGKVDFTVADTKRR